MSLTDNSLPAMATRHVLAALSDQILGQKHAAYTHQDVALRALQASIESRMLPIQCFQAMAASMLPSFYETLDDGGTRSVPPFSSAVPSACTLIEYNGYS
ncbi:hypothetical protein SPI_02576 [Niveomyces insectorum RCEF 264]|uniref:Uncharacterized protein n=1 Tax=Niveomyces insectorum RCEF 264 TaxID=1081102 RepID=A0A167Y3L4_9HYPO|nr:hypothetical protein SPI_02576 [Niveomyces insectorum RCEF 264]